MKVHIKICEDAFFGPQLSKKKLAMLSNKEWRKNHC
jgi:hypothetical protein